MSQSIEDGLVERPCDVCGKSLKAHQYGAGIPICPGIYAPGYRCRLNDKIAEQSDTITRLKEALAAIHEARLIDGEDRGYGWSITVLNRAMDAALPLIGRDVPPKPKLNVKALRSSLGGLRDHA